MKSNSLAFFGLLSVLVLSGCTTPIQDAVTPLPACEITYSDNLNPEDFRGIRLSPDYQLAIQGKPDPDYEKESARHAFDLFSRFHELPLTKVPACVSEAYRLTWVPSFHRTTTVRTWASEDGYFITTKRLERIAENRNGIAYTETTRKISGSEWQGVHDAVERLGFWHVASTENETIPNDGAAWLIEGMKNGNYHSVFRIGPSLEFERLIRKIFSVSGETTEIDLYLTAESVH